MSISWTPPDPTSRPLDALAFHIEHKHKDKISEIVSSIPKGEKDECKELRAALSKVAKVWSDGDFEKLNKALKKDVERKFVRLSIDSQKKVLALVSNEIHQEVKKFDPAQTARIINKIYQVEMLSGVPQTYRKTIDHEKR